MGSLIISVVLIFSIIKFFDDETEFKKKALIALFSFIIIIVVCLLFNINIMLYIIAAISTGLALYFKGGLIYVSKKQFLIIACIATFLSINMWGIIGSGVLCFYFDYGMIKGIYKGFTSMNSSYEFTLELINELILKSGYSMFSEELETIKEQLYPKLEIMDTIKTLLELTEYL